MSTRILIVEDESIVALHIRSSLLKLGYSVVGTCRRGEEAVEQARELVPEMVLMDIRLAGAIDGITAADEIRRTLGIPVIYLTAHADERTLERAKITEPFGYVLKPFEPIELRVAIELALFKAAQRTQLQFDGPQTPNQVSSQRSGISEADLSAQHRKIFEHIRQLPGFRVESETALATFSASCSLRELNAGETLVFEGDDRAHGFLMLEGRVALFKSSLSGREIIVELLIPGDLFGVAVTLEAQPYSFSARTQLSGSMIMVPRKALVRLLEDAPSLYRLLLEVISARLSRAHALSRALAHDRVEVRIANGLLSLIPAQTELDDSTSPTLHVTRKELAELCGTTVETSIRVTKNMEGLGILEFPENGFVKILKRDSLEEMSAA